MRTIDRFVLEVAVVLWSAYWVHEIVARARVVLP